MAKRRCFHQSLVWEYKNRKLEQTGNKEIYYAGHSQGTEQAFAGFSLDPGLGKKVKTFFALAPVGNLSGVESPIRYLAPFAKDIEV